MMKMSQEEQLARDGLVKLAKSLFDRGYTHGSSGNMSVMLSDNTIIATPTNSCFGDLDVNTLSKIDVYGNHLSGDKPTKEVPMHLAFYTTNAHYRAVVHLHSTYLTALSCLKDVNKGNCLPGVSPYFFMKVGKLPLLPYFKPGSQEIANTILQYAKTNSAILLANHGPVIAGKTLKEAVYNIEELENTAKLYFLLKPYKYNELSQAEINQLIT
nr:aldolase [Gilliamella apicola]